MDSIDDLNALIERHQQRIADLEYDCINSSDERMAEYYERLLRSEEDDYRVCVATLINAKAEQAAAIAALHDNPKWGIF